MVANNLLEVYTLVFAWNMYGAIWDVLNGTGLTLVPIIASLIISFRENYSSEDAQSTLAGMEITLIGTILVLMFCVIPFKEFSPTLASVKYTLATPACDALDPSKPTDTITGDGTNTGAAYQNGFATLTQGMSLHKPIAWAFVEMLSSAVTHSAIKSISCTNNYEFMLLRVANLTIDGNGLQKDIKDFHEQCYLPAMREFQANPVNFPPDIHQVDNIDWIGSRTFLNNPERYYHHKDAFVEISLPALSVFDRMDWRESEKSVLVAARPYCFEIWNGQRDDLGNTDMSTGLRSRILQDIADQDDENGDVRDAWTEWGYEVLTPGNTLDRGYKEDLLIKIVLLNNANRLESFSEISLTNDVDVDRSTSQKWFDFGISWLSTGSSVDQFLQAHAMRQVIKLSGPILLSMIQMVIIIAAPFLMLASRYRFSTFMSIAFTFFAFEFVNAIWAITFWFDNRLFDIILSEEGWFNAGPSFLIVSGTSAMAIVLLPSMWLGLMAYVGSMLRAGVGGAGGGGAVMSAAGIGKAANGMRAWGYKKAAGYFNKK